VIASDTNGIAAAVLVLAVALLTINILKAKYGMAVAGLFIGICWVFGAVRLAKPHSWWARRFYDDDKMRRATERFVLGYKPEAPLPIAPAESAPLCSGSKRKPHEPVRCSPVADPDDPTYRCPTCGREQRLPQTAATGAIAPPT
jgi:hypothetical protein